MKKWYTSVKRLGNKLFVRGCYDGVPYSDIVEYQPTLYLLSKEPTKFKSLDGEYLRPVKQPTISDNRKFLEQYKDVHGFKVFGNENPIYQYIADEFPDKIEFDMNSIKTYYLDIETTSEFGGVDVESAREQILLITLMDYKTKQTVTFGSRPFNKRLENNTYIECKNEAELLTKFLVFWEKSYPEIVSGWNIETFDIPYLVKRIQKTLGENAAKMLSPWKYIRSKEIIDRRTDKTQEAFEIYGVNTIDYLPFFKKYAGIGVENNKLDTVAKEVLNESKLDHEEYDTFADFYTKNWNLFVEYNIVDTVLIDKLEKKLRLIQLSVTLAMDSKVNPEDTLSQGRMWDAIIYNHLLAKNIIIPVKSSPQEKTEKYVGAYVKEPQIGKFKWVVTFDVSSLYPSLIRTFNISPETLVQTPNSYVSVDNIVNEALKIEPEHKQYSICPNGSMYRNDKKGFLPTIMEEMFNERIVYKKKMLEYQKQYEQNPTNDLEELIATYRILQESKKQCLNSAYGSLGNNAFRFYDIRNAEAITYSGQAVIKTVEKNLNAYLHRISGQNIDMCIAGDTDSCVLNLEPIVNKIFKDKEATETEVINFLCSICDNQIQGVIDDIFISFTQRTNAFENHLHMKREKICSSGLWKAKKNYILNVWDNEGVRYSEPKIKISGIEAVKTSVPAICRTRVKEAFKIIMNKEEEDLIKFVKDFKEEFFALPPEDISFPRRVSDVDKWKSATTTYIKRTPIQARAAILYNKQISDKNLLNKYPIIKNGENLKYCYLKEPNPLKEDVVGFVQRFPTELGLVKFVDYQKQFELAFLQPLTKILDVIGWRTEKTYTLDELFT
jgi:DNA polymerase elongation subunit (family B)